MAAAVAVTDADDDEWLYGDDKDTSRDDEHNTEDRPLNIVSADPGNEDKDKESSDEQLTASALHDDLSIMPVPPTDDAAVADANAPFNQDNNKADPPVTNDTHEPVPAAADEDEDDSDDDVHITIGDIKTGAVEVPRTIKPHQRATQPKTQVKGVDLEATGTINGEPVYEFDLDSLGAEDKPWRKPGADITDYFNYGFNEDTWKQYCEKQRRLRIESSAKQITAVHSGPMDAMMVMGRGTMSNNVTILQHTGKESPHQMIRPSGIRGGAHMVSGGPPGMPPAGKGVPPPPRKMAGTIDVIESRRPETTTALPPPPTDFRQPPYVLPPPPNYSMPPPPPGIPAGVPPGMPPPGFVPPPPSFAAPPPNFTFQPPPSMPFPPFGPPPGVLPGPPPAPWDDREFQDYPGRGGGRDMRVSEGREGGRDRELDRRERERDRGDSRDIISSRDRERDRDRDREREMLQRERDRERDRSPREAGELSPPPSRMNEYEREYDRDYDRGDRYQRRERSRSRERERERERRHREERHKKRKHREEEEEEDRHRSSRHKKVKRSKREKDEKEGGSNGPAGSEHSENSSQQAG